MRALTRFLNYFLARLLTHSLVHPLAHPLTHPPSLTNSLVPSLTTLAHLLSHSCTHSLAPSLILPVAHHTSLTPLAVPTAGTGDSSPSHDKANKPSTSEQPHSPMVPVEGDKAGADVAGSGPPAEQADRSAAASTPQRPPVQEGLLQTPQRMASASAFSVFMSPLVRGSGTRAMTLCLLCTVWLYLCTHFALHGCICAHFALAVVPVHTLHCMHVSMAVSVSPVVLLHCAVSHSAVRHCHGRFPGSHGRLCLQSPGMLSDPPPPASCRHP